MKNYGFKNYTYASHSIPYNKQNADGNMYRIAGKFGGNKVWQIYSYKVLVRKSLANR